MPPGRAAHLDIPPGKHRGQRVCLAIVPFHVSLLSATEFSRDEIDTRAMDVASAIGDLSPREQEICRGLADGLSVAQLAKQMGCGWHTVARIIRRLRQRFEQLGLDGWAKE